MLSRSVVVLCGLLVSGLVSGCANLEKEAVHVDSIVARMHSDDFAVRQSATEDLLSRDSVSMRHLVVPKLALASARTPLEVTSRAGNMTMGRVTGGDERTLQIEVTERVLAGAGVSIPVAEIKVIRLFEP